MLLDEDDNVVIDRLKFESLIEMTVNHCNLHDEVSKIRERCKERFGKGGSSTSEPAKFKPCVWKQGRQRFSMY